MSGEINTNFQLSFCCCYNPGRVKSREAREDEQRCTRWCAGSDGRRETAPADRRAGRPGSRGAGAACVEPRSPAPTAAAAAAVAAAAVAEEEEPTGADTEA